eukprot:15346878-Ditylum_brightwellii.AAC.1
MSLCSFESFDCNTNNEHAKGFVKVDEYSPKRMPALVPANSWAISSIYFETIPCDNIVSVSMKVERLGSETTSNI